MRLDCDVVVIGAGLAGAAACWELTGRGRSVVLLEARALHHRDGSSHGTSRIYRRAYPDPFYVRLTGRADAEWDRLEADAGVTLRVRTGGIDSGGSRDLARMADLLSCQGVDADLLAPGEVARRWPGMTVDGPVLFHPDAGHLDPDATIAACIDLARGRGLTVVDNTPACSLRHTASGVVVSTPQREYTAGRVVVAAGAWLPELLPRLGPASSVALPTLWVKQQEVFHFRRRDPSPVWPVWIHKDDIQVYSVASGADGGPAPAWKVGQFDSASATTASGRDGRIDPAARAVACAFVARHLPGLDPDPVAEQSCLFTMTGDEDFVLDRDGDVVIASPCSGHGAKFAPLLGVLIADLVDGAPADPRFAFRR